MVYQYTKQTLHCSWDDDSLSLFNLKLIFQLEFTTSLWVGPGVHKINANLDSIVEVGVEFTTGPGGWVGCGIFEINANLNSS